MDSHGNPAKREHSLAALDPYPISPLRLIQSPKASKPPAANRWIRMLFYVAPRVIPISEIALWFAVISLGAPQIRCENVLFSRSCPWGVRMGLELVVHDLEF